MNLLHLVNMEQDEQCKVTKVQNQVSTPIWEGLLGIRFEVDGGDNPQSRTRQNYARKQTVGTVQYQGLFNFADISIFCKKSALFGRNSTFTLSNNVRPFLEIFQGFFFRFCKVKGYYYRKYKFYRLCVRNLDSGLLQFGHKWEK